jgi:pectate lyase
MHLYNNYYLNCSTCQDIRANAYCFSEANYFASCAYPKKVTTTSTYTGTAIKSFGDVFSSCTHASAATIVSERAAAVTNACKPDGSTDYSAFDTSNSLFYYNATTQQSDVTLLLAASAVPAYVSTMLA